jgi:site-specific recombinase
VATPTLKKIFRVFTDLVRPSYEREQLYYLLESADPKASLTDRLAWLERLMYWVRTLSPHRHGFDEETGQLHNVRIRFVLHLLDRQPEWKPRVAATLWSIARDTSALSLFSQIGLGQQKGFLAEASDRMLKRLLPRPAQERNLSELFLRIFENEEDAIWVRHISSSLMGQIITLVQTEVPAGSRLFEGWNQDIQDALLILGARVSSIGTQPEILSRLKASRLASLPFLRLGNRLTDLIENSNHGVVDRQAAKEVFAEIEKCRGLLAKIYLALEESGVSVALVYTLENLSGALKRIEPLVKLLLPPSDETPTLITGFLSNLVEECLAQGTLFNLVRVNLHLISSKIVERAGNTGEHYISRTRQEYFEMLRAGTGGGAIMVGTTLVKYSLTALKLPLLFEGIFYSINYGLSFVVLQLLGFTLATKQPSATASTLAGKLKELEEEGEVRQFVNIVCRMTRTQFAALIGNLLLLIPLAILMDMGLWFSAGRHFFPTDVALHTLDSLHPFRSITLPMAALTGVWLWLSSLAAGWLENWVVFRQIPEALSSNRRLVAVFGPQGARKIGEWSLNKSTLLGGNLSLGLLMGFTSVFGSFVGLPLEVRHVTLSSASLVFSVCSLADTQFDWTTILFPALGVACVGLLNFAVGYSLAFAVAVRARQVKLGPLRRLFRAVRIRFRNRPREFFFPPRARKANLVPAVEAAVVAREDSSPS